MRKRIRKNIDSLKSTCSVIASLIAILWAFGKRAPAILAVLRSLVAVLKAEQFQALIESICGATKAEADKLPAPPKTENERWRLLDRIGY